MDCCAIILNINFNFLHYNINNAERRSNIAPRGAETDESVFKGTSSKGYSVMKRSDMLRDSVNFDGTENRASKWQRNPFIAVMK